MNTQMVEDCPEKLESFIAEVLPEEEFVAVHEVQELDFIIDEFLA